MFTNERVAKRDLGNLASPVDRAHMRRPLDSTAFSVSFWMTSNAQTIAQLNSWLLYVSKGDDIKIKRKVIPFFLPPPGNRPFIAVLSLYFALLHGLEAALLKRAVKSRWQILKHRFYKSRHIYFCRILCHQLLLYARELCHYSNIVRLNLVLSKVLWRQDGIGVDVTKTGNWERGTLGTGKGSLGTTVRR